MTTWQITMGAPADTEPLARDLARGTPLGKALARFNRSASARRTGQLMCLLGDPDLRLSTTVRLPAVRTPLLRNGTSLNDQRQLAFLAAYLDTIAVKHESKATHAAARNAVAAPSGWRGRERQSMSPASLLGRRCGKQCSSFYARMARSRLITGWPLAIQ